MCDVGLVLSGTTDPAALKMGIGSERKSWEDSEESLYVDKQLLELENHFIKKKQLLLSPTF